MDQTRLEKMVKDLTQSTQHLLLSLQQQMVLQQQWIYQLMAVMSANAKPPWSPRQLVKILKRRKDQQREYLQTSGKHLVAMEKMHKAINNEHGTGFLLGSNLNELLNSLLDEHDKAIDTAVEIIECNSEAEPWLDSLGPDEDLDGA